MARQLWFTIQELRIHFSIFFNNVHAEHLTKHYVPA